jgi:hypothetical protein
MSRMKNAKPMVASGGLSKLDCFGGRLLVLVFLVGLSLIALSLGVEKAGDVLAGALACLWALLGRPSRSDASKS